MLFILGYFSLQFDRKQLAKRKNSALLPRSMDAINNNEAEQKPKKTTAENTQPHYFQRVNSVLMTAS